MCHKHFFVRVLSVSNICEGFITFLLRNPFVEKRKQ